MLTIACVQRLDVLCLKHRQTVVHFSLATIDHEGSREEICSLARILGVSAEEFRGYLVVQACIREGVLPEIIAQQAGLPYGQFSRYLEKRVDELAQLRQEEEDAATV